MIGKHFSAEMTVGYLYHTLTDAEREEMDAHLPHCPRCRALLSAHEAQQKRLEWELQQAFREVTLPGTMQFAAIAPQLQSRSSRVLRWERFLNGFTMATAVSGLLLAFLSLWQTIQPPFVWDPPLSTAATVCFGLTTIGQFDRRMGVSLSQLVAILLALLLWLGTAVIGLQNILILRDLFIWGMVALGTTTQTALGLSSLSLLPASILWIAVVIGGAEYHRHRLGQPESWRLFALTIIAQLWLLLLPRFLF